MPPRRDGLPRSLGIDAMGWCLIVATVLGIVLRLTCPWLLDWATIRGEDVFR